MMFVMFVDTNTIITVTVYNSPYLMSETVIELSAILVDKMTFLVSSRGLSNTLTCSSAVMLECNGKISSLQNEQIRYKIKNQMQI